MMGVSAVLLVGVGLALQLTRSGKAIRAVADDRDLAESSGVDVERVISLVWVAGGALAAVGGIFYGLSQQVSWQMGQQLLLLMFAAVILGGIGTAYGALAGGLVIGLFFQLSALWVAPELRLGAALLVLILVMVARPQGILGQAERVG
jgi:branched-chain amino acid transport system permease protein